MTLTMRLGSIRAHIFGQHDELSRLLHLANAVVGAAARGDADCRAELPRLFDLLAGKLKHHLTFEEEHLWPALLASDRPDDVARAEQLVDDHARQRERLFSLARQFHESSGPDPALVRAFAQLEEELRSDIAEEERWLLEQTPFGAEAASSQ